MLIVRKVPEDYARFVNVEVVRCGAEILKRGEGFEVHLEPDNSSITYPVHLAARQRRIRVTPLVARSGRF